MDIIGHRKIFYAISGILILVGLVSFGIYGLKPGIDFLGGSLIELEFEGERPDVQEVKNKLADLDLGEINIQLSGEKGLTLRLKDIDQKTHQEILEKLGVRPMSVRKGLRELEIEILGPQGEPVEGVSLEPSGESTKIKSLGIVEKRFDSIGPSIGRELRNRAILGIILVLFGISIYVALAFRKVSKPLTSWRYGVVTVLTLFHDILIVTGLFSIYSHFREVEIDSAFIVALLVVMGFSVHDTIVVFDRTRENLRKRTGKESFAEIVNRSVNETKRRSICTSFAIVLVLVALLLFGAPTLFDFVLVLLTGTIVGTYSSIFIASPVLVDWEKRISKRY